MSLRALGSLLTRRIPRAQAEALGSAAGRAARSLHTLGGLAVGDGTYGVVAAAALAGLAGVLHFKKDADESAGEVTGDEARKEVPDREAVKKVTGGEEDKEVTGGEAIKKGDMKQAAVKALFEDNGDDFSLEKYLAEMTELAAAQKKARYKREVSGKKAMNEVTGREAVKQEDMKDEAVMKARFEDWIKEYDRRYKNEEEKAWRYEIFKAFAKTVDKATAQSGGALFVTNHTADWTEEECECLYGGEVDWDDYLDHIKSLIAKKRAKEVSDKKAIRVVTDSEAIKQRNKELGASHTQGSQADNL
ncbi:uncharacterized protein LOC133893488 [Phragmites australis]|uniref:uncharacterized protein LOC133893488 n=1 Tax=Phragmites australis TaxID=29695 RepID=UPI002D769702|nr:uncharacterized protein LOC133893488 [Phragmites australis]